MASVMDRSKIVVVLEDDHEVRSLLATVLQDQGYYVVPVDNGERALAVLQQVRATLLIMDLGLTGMDGNEVIRQVRADERTRDVPVMVLSARVPLAGNGSKPRTSRIIKKPFQIDQVLAEVERIIGKAGDGSLELSTLWASAS